MKRGAGGLLAAAAVLAALAATLLARVAPGFDARSVLAGAPAADARKAGATARPIGNGRVPPDWAFTPGRLCAENDPDFKEFRYPEHIPYCRRNVTERMKQEVAAHYGIPRGEWPNYEFDHLIPLGIGGDSHIDNLWPQPRAARLFTNGGRSSLFHETPVRMA